MEKNKNIDDYFDSVAGFTELADKKRIFIVEPNGRSKRIKGFGMKILISSPVVQL